MRMLGHNRLFQAAVVAAGIVALGATDALARSRGSYGSYGSSGSSASYGSSSSSSYGSYGSSSSSSYGSYGSSGSSASYGSSSGGRPGLMARWHARKAAKHSSGSSASYGTYAYSSSGSSASYGSVSYYGGSSSSGSSASYGGYAAPSGVYDQGVPVEYSAPVEAPMETQPAPPEVPTPDAAAAIRVTLPTDAVVFVNDRPTTSTGGERSYVSRGLVGGRTYAYALRVEFNRDGEKVVENKTVRLKAGESIDLSFGDGEQIAANAESTDLTLHVPAGAKVTLAGAITKQTGETRTYSTTTLAPGQEWDGYVVRVELEQDGKTLVEEKTLSIVGGESYEFSFDFAQDSTQIASLN
jgi:uncharacterized protein (TIGR03000 family)